MSVIGETFIDRVAALERRLGALEAALQTGVLGTDQTIKASHDRLDSLLGAGVAAPDGTLVTNFNADLLDGYHASALGGAEVTLYTASSTVEKSITTVGSEVTLWDTAIDVPVIDGDMVIFFYDTHVYGTTSDSPSAYLKLFLGTNGGHPRVVDFRNVGFFPVALHYALTATGSGTWDIIVKCYLYTGTNPLKSRYDQAVVLRIRP